MLGGILAGLGAAGIGLDLFGQSRARSQAKKDRKEQAERDAWESLISVAGGNGPMQAQPLQSLPDVNYGRAALGLAGVGAGYELSQQAAADRVAKQGQMATDTALKQQSADANTLRAKTYADEVGRKAAADQAAARLSEQTRGSTNSALRQLDSASIDPLSGSTLSAPLMKGQIVPPAFGASPMTISSAGPASAPMAPSQQINALELKIMQGAATPEEIESYKRFKSLGGGAGASGNTVDLTGGIPGVTILPR